MDALVERLNYFNAQADKELSKYPQLVSLERQTNVPKTYMAAGVVAFVFTLIFFNIWGELLSDIIGWLYPGMGKETLISYQGDIDKNLNKWKNKLEDVARDAGQQIASEVSKSEKSE
ncbi:11458_t:CDS:2 [Racocetra fulgida]|uniref:11458_t:CDS:1 n=1 Tax=Racocetra fulgida TaxID=60492 RepID=A0A9N8W4X6_9GLOM|nr:11458_t:CDS:2 [Racocetra fulgida]